MWFWLERLPLVCFVECNGINCIDLPLTMKMRVLVNVIELSPSEEKIKCLLFLSFIYPYSVLLFCPLDCSEFGSKQSWPWYSAIHFLSIVFSCSWKLLVKPIYFVKNKMSTPKDNVFFLMFNGDEKTYSKHNTQPWPDDHYQSLCLRQSIRFDKDC